MCGLLSDAHEQLYSVSLAGTCGLICMFLSWSSSQLLLYELLPPLRHTNTTDAHKHLSFYFIIQSRTMLNILLQFIQELSSIQKGYYKILILCNGSFFFGEYGSFNCIFCVRLCVRNSSSTLRTCLF